MEYGPLSPSDPLPDQQSFWYKQFLVHHTTVAKEEKLEMWANAQRDGRPAEYRWRPVFNAAKFG